MRRHWQTISSRWLRRRWVKVTMPAPGRDLLGLRSVTSESQRSVSPTRATLIYAGEPVWAGIIGRIAGDRLPPLALAGGLLIVAAMIVSEMRFGKRDRAST